MKIKLVLAVALGMLAFAGIAEAAGLFNGRPAMQNALLKRERTLMRKARLRGRRAAPQAGVSRARRGPRGFRGPRGAQGPQGPPGAFSTITQVAGPETYLCGYEYECSVEAAHAECPAGSHVVSGGWAGPFLGTVFFSFASGNGWSVGVANEGLYGTSFHATAICVT